MVEAVELSAQEIVNAHNNLSEEEQKVVAALAIKKAKSGEITTGDVVAALHASRKLRGEEAPIEGSIISQLVEKYTQIMAEKID